MFLCVTGGHREFHKRHRDLCEDALLPGPCPGSPNEAGLDTAPASRVLPFLYLGSARDAADNECMNRLGISRVLNVSCQAPQHPNVTTKHLPADDSGHQNLKQYFEEAFQFIGKFVIDFLIVFYSLLNLLLRFKHHTRVTFLVYCESFLGWKIFYYTFSKSWE